MSMTVRAARQTFLMLAFIACRAQPSPARWPNTVALKPLEGAGSGCYRVHGITRSDSAETGFAADSILRLDAAILRVTVPPQGPDIREYVNEHPFRPRPPNFDTTWWVGHDGALHLEWRTPRQSSKVFIYGGGMAVLRTTGDSLVGETTVFRDAGEMTNLAIALKRLPHCPEGLAPNPGVT